MRRRPRPASDCSSPRITGANRNPSPVAGSNLTQTSGMAASSIRTPSRSARLYVGRRGTGCCYLHARCAPSRARDRERPVRVRLRSATWRRPLALKGVALAPLAVRPPRRPHRQGRSRRWLDDRSCHGPAIPTRADIPRVRHVLPGSLPDAATIRWRPASLDR